MKNVDKVLREVEDIIRKYGYKADIIAWRKDGENHYTITLGFYEKKNKEEDWIMRLGYGIAE